MAPQGSTVFEGAPSKLVPYLPANWWVFSQPLLQQVYTAFAFSAFGGQGALHFGAKGAPSTFSVVVSLGDVAVKRAGGGGSGAWIDPGTERRHAAQQANTPPRSPLAHSLRRWRPATTAAIPAGPSTRWAARWQEAWPQTLNPASAPLRPSLAAALA